MTAVVLPVHPNTCRGCLGTTEQLGRTCRACNGSGVANPDAAMREHWGYRDGYAAHHAGRDRGSCLFPAGTFAHRCWCAGWHQAEREAVRESNREKLENEAAHG
jgi:hypothetical protein